MDATLDTLPGEGETKIVKKVRVRATCEECGEPAHYKQTFLLPNCRRNPDSKAYLKDDCSWCEDASRFSCVEHEESTRYLEGYEHCSTFPASARFAHMFLSWEVQP